jgi:hypothetical protein
LKPKSFSGKWLPDHCWRSFGASGWAIRRAQARRRRPAGRLPHEGGEPKHRDHRGAGRYGGGDQRLGDHCFYVGCRLCGYLRPFGCTWVNGSESTHHGRSLRPATSALDARDRGRTCHTAWARAVFPGCDGRDAGLIDWRVRLERGDQVLIAAISGPTPKIVIIRLRL